MADNKMEISTKLAYNFIIDMKKKEINPIEKGQIIKEYMEQNKKGLRELSRETAIPLTTLKGWIDYAKMTIEEYEKLIKDGKTKTDIHKMVKNDKSVNSPLDITLKETMIRLRPYILHTEISGETQNLISELKNIIARLELNIERNHINK